MISRSLRHFQSNNIFKRIFNRLSIFDKWIILFLLGVIFVDIGIISFRQWVTATNPVPIKGGIYIEGMVASSLADIKPTLDVLTKVGFIDYDNDHNFQPAAAESWEISADNKTYTFQMKSSINKQLIEESISKNKNLFPNVNIEVTDDLKVIFKLKQPFSPFLTTTTTPIFPLGPYEIEKEDKGIVKLTSRTGALTKEPFLQELIIKVYPDSFNLTQALAAGEIQGIADLSKVDNSKLVDKLATYELELPRKIFLFFNTERELLKTAKIRRDLKDGKKLDQPIELSLITLASAHNEELAQKLAKSWEELNVKTNIITYSNTELAQDIIPERDYDVLIYGLDFGGDPDPYPFWHSSQIGKNGLNLASFANIDADRLLEKARQNNNDEERKKLYEEFGKILDREVPAIELEKVTWKFAVDREIGGIKSSWGLTSADHFRDIEYWYRRTKREKK